MTAETQPPVDPRQEGHVDPYRGPAGGPAYYGSLVFAILLISLACFRFPRAPINPQTDPSWNAVLVYAHEQGLQFGRDIVFTYGPLGFLSVEYFSPAAGVARLFSETLLTLLIVSGFCMLAWRIKIGWRIVLLIFFVVVTAPLHWGSDLLFFTGLLSWGMVCFLEARPRLKLFVPVLVILAAIEALTKFNLLVLATLTIGWLTIDLCWRGKWGLAVVAIAGYVATFVLGWILLGQSLGWLAAFVKNAFAVAAGYNQTMASSEISWHWLLAVTVAALLTAFIRVITSRNTATNFPFIRNAWLLLWLLGIFFVTWKYAAVRADYYHAILPLGFLPLLTIALESLPASHPRAMFCGRFGALICTGLAIVLLANLNNSSSAGGFLIDSARKTFRYFHENAQIVWRPKDYLAAQNKSFHDEQIADLLPKTRSLAQHATVDVFGSDQALALLNALNYRPRPVFQSYSAYTRRLMELNDAYYTGPSAPEFVLFKLAAIDGRFPPLEDAFTLRELLVNYSLAEEEKGLLLLRKKQNVTPVQLTLLSQGDVQFREKISLVEFAGTNLWIEFDPRLNSLGRFRQFICQPPALQLRVWNAGTNFTNFSAPAPMLAAGFLISPLALNTGDVRQLYTGGGGQRPAACAVDTADASLQFFEPQIHFRLYRLENPLGQSTDRKISERSCGTALNGFSASACEKNHKFNLPSFSPLIKLFSRIIRNNADVPNSAASLSPTTMQTSTEIGYNSKVEGDVIVTRVDAALNWFRKNSIWPMPMGLACCAIELMAAGASRFDISRFGSEVMRFSPRQSDVMIVAGTVTYKMALAVKRIYDQMAEPKWVIAMGACASTGGMYRSYAVLQGVDRIIPVDVYVAGCPPRPEALLDALMKLQNNVVAKQPVLSTQRKVAA